MISSEWKQAQWKNIINSWNMVCCNNKRQRETTKEKEEREWWGLRRFRKTK